MSLIPAQAYSSGYVEPIPVSASGPARAGVINDPPSTARKFLELLFYTIVGLGLFQTQLGLQSARFLLGGTTLCCGCIAALITLMGRGTIPTTVWFYLLMSFGASLSQAVVSGETPIIGTSVSPFILFPCHLLMLGYVVRNEAACKRVMIVLSLYGLVAIKVAGIDITETAHQRRLGLKNIVAGTLTDPNSMAYFIGILAVSILFWSLRSSKIIRPALWLWAAVLFLVIIRAVSRGGAVAAVCGLAVLLAAILLGRGVRLSGLITILVAFLVGSVLLSTASDSLDFLTKRFTSHDETIRSKVYTWRTVEDLWDTMILGRGVEFSRTSAGIHAHNSYIYTQMTYGGITAIPYVAMLVVMATRLTRMLFSPDLPMDIRLWVSTLFGMSFISQMFSNMSYLNPDCTFAFAVIGCYTAPYSGRRVKSRKLLRRQASLASSAYEPWPLPQ